MMLKERSCFEKRSLGFGFSKAQREGAGGTEEAEAIRETVARA
jgi:hypothetical protein